MAKTIIINGVTYTDVPFTESPLASNPQQKAKFYDTDDATLDNGNKMLDGVTAYSNGVKYTGSIQSKSAQTYTPTTSDQTIASGQYLGGVQTIKGDVNLSAGNIKKNVTIFGITGTLDSATIVQDQVTKGLSIS